MPDRADSTALTEATIDALARGFRLPESSPAARRLLRPLSRRFARRIGRFDDLVAVDGLAAGARTDKPAGAWTADQTADFMIERLAAGDFYILCPDNDVDRGLDEKRIAWAVSDIIENRPALSRWHPDYAAAFEAFVAER